MPYRRATRLGQALCRHECERVGHGADFETTVWFCRKCGKEISIEPPKSNVLKAEAEAMGHIEWTLMEYPELKPMRERLMNENSAYQSLYDVLHHEEGRKGCDGE